MNRTTIGIYVKEKDKVLGQGGYGSVCMGLAPDNTKVAIKEMMPLSHEKGITQSGLREIVIMKNLKHINIVSILDARVETGKLYIIMELMNKSLGQALKETGAFSQDYLKEITKQLLRGLEFAHQRGIVHRDIKPHNILLSTDNTVAKLADWGCAKYYALPVGRSSSRVSTIWYRPPEIMMGVKDHVDCVDIWSLGCVIGEMATGKVIFGSPQPRYPFPEKEQDQMKMIMQALGFPTLATWPGVNLLDGYYKYRSLAQGYQILHEPEVDQERALANLVPNLSTAGIRFLKKLVILCPSRRVTAAEAIADEYLSD